MSAFKGWKKVRSEKDHSVLRNDDGHELHIAHSALSPKLRGHLAEIPVHKEDNQNGSKAVKDNKGSLKLAEGGRVSTAEQRQDIKETFSGGDKKSTAQPYESRPTKLSPTVMKGETAAPKAAERDPDAEEAKASAESTSVDFHRMADGGEVPPPEEIVPGVPATASNPNQFDFEQKKAKIAQSDMNYATPQQAEVGVATKALDQIDNEKVAGAQAAASVGAEQGAAYQQAVDLNKRLVAAGQAPLPLPEAPAATPQAGLDQPSQAQQGALGAAPQGDGQPSDPFGTRATADAYTKGIGEEKAGIAGEARALGAQGQMEAKIAHDQAVNQASMLDEYKNNMGVLNKQREDLQKAVMEGKIDPNHYIGSMTTTQKVGTMIGLILGGIGSGAMHQENPALKMLNMQIDRDIDAQKANLGTKKSLLEYNMQQTGNLNAATNMTKAMMNDMASAKLKEAAAKSMDPLAKARALQAAGKIDQQSAAIIGQNAMRTSMLSGLKNGKVSPAAVVEMAVPEGSRPAARKELKDMEDAVQMRDHVMSAFDQLAKINTIGNRITSPIQSKRQIDAIMGPALDKVTKDTSGRVTPETVGLIKNAFGSAGNSPETQMKARASLNALLSQGMNYPTLRAFGISPDGMGRSAIKTAAPVPNKK